MKKLMLAAAVSVVAIASAVPASATVFVLNGGAAITPTVGNSYGQNTNEDYGLLGAGQYTSYYQFTLGTNAVMSFASYTDAGSSATYGTNAAVVYRGTCSTSSTCSALTQLAGSGATMTQNGNETFGLSGMLNQGSYTVRVTGTVNNTAGNLSGNFLFRSAVPESATWAMMLSGFGLVGGALRSSRRKVGLLNA